MDKPFHQYLKLNAQLFEAGLQEDASDPIRDQMDPLWPLLSQEQKAVISLVNVHLLKEFKK